MPTDHNSVPWLTAVRQQVESLRYGTVVIVVHDGRVAQIERTEKLRFDQTGRKTVTTTGLTGDE